MRALTHGDAARAVMLARRMVLHDPLSDGPHVLLVKALAACRDRESADRQVETSAALLTRELGVAPVSAMRDAARPTIVAPAVGVSAAASAAFEGTNLYDGETSTRPRRCSGRQWTTRAAQRRSRLSSVGPGSGHG